MDQFSLYVTIAQSLTEQELDVAAERARVAAERVDSDGGVRGPRARRRSAVLRPTPVTH